MKKRIKNTVTHIHFFLFFPGMSGEVLGMLRLLCLITLLALSRLVCQQSSDSFASALTVSERILQTRDEVSQIKQEADQLEVGRILLIFLFAESLLIHFHPPPFSLAPCSFSPLSLSPLLSLKVTHSSFPFSFFFFFLSFFLSRPFLSETFQLLFSKSFRFFFYFLFLKIGPYLNST